jgi:hypothetical protein
MQSRAAALKHAGVSSSDAVTRLTEVFKTNYPDWVANTDWPNLNSMTGFVNRLYAEIRWVAAENGSLLRPLFQDGTLRTRSINGLGMSLLAVLQDFVQDQAARASYEGADQRAVLAARHVADRNTNPCACADGDCRAFQWVLRRAIGARGMNIRPEAFVQVLNQVMEVRRRL